MIARWESDLYEDPRDAIAAAEEAAGELRAMGYKVSAISWDYYIVYDDEGVGSVAGKQSFFWYGEEGDELPGEESTKAGKTMALVVGATALILVGTVVAIGIAGK